MSLRNDAIMPVDMWITPPSIENRPEPRHSGTTRSAEPCHSTVTHTRRRTTRRQTDPATQPPANFARAPGRARETRRVCTAAHPAGPHQVAELGDPRRVEFNRPYSAVLQFDQQPDRKGTGVTNSALRKTGSTRQWRIHRGAWLPIINSTGIACRYVNDPRPFHRCPHPDPIIRAGEPWDLAHPPGQYRANGADDSDTRPAHPDCNRRDQPTCECTDHQLQHAPERKW